MIRNTDNMNFQYSRVPSMNTSFDEMIKFDKKYSRVSNNRGQFNLIKKKLSMMIRIIRLLKNVYFVPLFDT